MSNLYRFLMGKEKISILHTQFLLRCTMMMAVMIFGGGGAAWGQVADGVYYITNTADPGNLPSPNPAGYDRWYLWPSVTTNSSTGQQYVTTYYDAQAAACNENGVSYDAFDSTYSHWVVKNLNDGTGRFQLINPKLNKYIVIRSKESYGDRDVWLDDEPTGDEIVRSYFKLNGSSSPYLISPTINADATAYTGGILTLNSAKGNKRYLCSTNDQQTPLNTDQRRGLLQFYDSAPKWTFTENKLSAPTISEVSATSTITITDANDLPVGYTTIRYTTDGSDPWTSTEYSEYSGPIDVTSSMTVKAVVVGYGIVLTNLAEKTVSPVAVAAPTVTNNYDGTISLSTTTPDATIYYSINDNDNDPDNTSTPYSSPFSLGDATVIKAIAYVGEEYSDVTTYNVPKYTTPTISFDDNTSLITITSEGTVYYNTGDGSQDDPTSSSGTLYNEPFIVSSDITVKAIATHAGYLNSDVATWSAIRGYLTFNVLTDGTICWKAFGDLTKTISYRINGGSWTDITSTSAGVTINVYEDDVVEFKGSNETYATSKSNYSGFEGGTATFNIEGNIHSLLYGDNFADNNSLTNSTFQFCSLFKKAKVKSAENLILPATTLKNYCYRALFSWCTTLEKAPVLPATTLATGCYWYMFEQCAIETAPDLLATTLKAECYGHMFEGCSNLNYIKCMATSGLDASKCLENWVLNVASSGMFVKNENTSWTSGESGIPTLWYSSNNTALYPPSISFDGETIELSCQTDGASIFYRFSNEDPYSLYTQPIAISENVVIETYSTDGNQNSVVITQSCIYVHETPFEASNKTLSTWTYNGHVITTPYSVNRIDGHSSSYAKGTFNFETTVNLRTEQPTYLWFQHADQKADIYVDNVKVDTHYGGYNAFFSDITGYVHRGTNHIKVAICNNNGNTLAPIAGDFNFNATLGNVKLFTSPVLPSMDYGYDGFHITSSVTDASATINIKTSIPVGASVVCTISDGTYYWTETQNSTGEEQTFTTTIQNPHLWNGTIDPHLYNVKLEIFKDNELYHRYERPYGFRYYEYVINEPIGNEFYTGFLLNGSPYLLRGVCIHDDLDGKANALNEDDYVQEFAIIQELGCNFLRLAHYPHPKEVYDWCDRLGIIVQTEVPCVNKMQSTLPEDYYNHLTTQYEDMVNQHYNHPCIVFWGLSNETTTDDKDFAKDKINEYITLIKNLDASRMVGYVMSHSINDPSGYYNDPDADWFGCNIYGGWYINQNSNDPTSLLNTRLDNTLTRLSKPLAFSEYGGGGTQHCHSDDFMTTTTRGNNPRHDIEYQMWLHEGHIAAIKEKPQLLFTSQWQLFDIAVYNRTEGYKVCLDGETVFDNNALNRLNNKGLVERDHKTKKDPFYLYKAWWNPADKFVHICGKDYEKRTDRVIKCYTNDDGPFSLYVNDVLTDTKAASNYIVLFEAQNFDLGDVIRVVGSSPTINDTFTFTNTNVFKTNGNWNEASNWSAGTVPTANSDVAIMANAIVPSDCTANADNINLYLYSSLTIADGGQIVSNSAVNATVEKNIIAYTVSQNEGDLLTDGWYFIASPITNEYTPTGSMVENTYDLYRLNPTTTRWENYKNTTDHLDFTTLNNGAGYLYANSANTTLSFTGTLKPFAASESVSVSTGWNLIGNPFTYNVYANRSFYKMNEAKTGVEAVSTFSTSPIAPCTGIVVEAETDGNVIFSKEVPTQSQGSNNSLQIALSQANTRDNALLDKAIVSFDEDNQLGKFYFGTQNANIYIPQDGKDYAIAYSEGQGEVPVNFKANENGSYALTVNPEGVEMAYLHLIDNMTGADIDLLQTPNYTFNANVTNYESRFKLVFASVSGDADGEGDNFAFFSNGNWIIANEGQATLQVIDITGRILSSEKVNGSVSKAINATPGVYVLRLINGDNVKVQKIVVR